MSRQPTDSTAIRPQPADTAGHTRPSQQPHKQPKTVYRVLKSLPPDATPAQQDSAVRANFPVPELTFPAGRRFHLPLAKDSDVTPRLCEPHPFEHQITKNVPWGEQPLTLHTYGQAGDPLPYRFRTDDYVTSTLLLSFFLVVWILSRSRHQLGHALKGFFGRPARNASANHEATALQGRTFVTFQMCFLLGILFTDYTQEKLPAVFNQSSPYLILLFGVTMCAAYFALKTVLYRLVNVTFFGRERAEAWRNAYSLVLTGEGLALLPVTLLLVYFDIDFETLTIAFVSVIAVAKLLLTWQTYRLFFGTPLGCVHLFLYFCGLEILPLALLWRALVFLSQYLITIT